MYLRHRSFPLRSALNAAPAATSVKVRFEPGTGYEHRFTKPVKEFLSRQILGHADDIREAAAFVDTHRNMTVHVVWDEEGPSHNSLRESAIYWVEVDYAVTIRFAIGAFEEFEDTHDNQALIGTFRIKGITDAYSSISRRARK